MEQSEDTSDLSWSEQVEAELAKKKADPSYIMTLPNGCVLDAEMPDGYYRKRPCLEEFHAAYPELDYNKYFSAEGVAGSDEFDWGPPWSDPQWSAKKFLETMTVPEYFQVRSQVRRVATRAKRAASPTRHRFKQFLFGNPAFRMVRGRHVKVPAIMLLSNLDELVAKEEAGLLSVHLPDGRYVDLMALKAGQLEAAPAPVPAPLPNPPLDSIEQDVNGGTPIPEMLDGTFYNDPAAERAVSNMLKDKANEQDRDTPTNEEDAAAKTAPVNPQPAADAGAAGEVQATADTEVAEVVDPAAARLEEKTSDDTEDAAPQTKSSRKGGKK